jgi:predicted SnoaL-like aldol condensation-catalyzing enzyme
MKNFVKDVFVSGQTIRLSDNFDADNYIQHNSNIPDQISGFENALNS